MERSRLISIICSVEELEDPRRDHGKKHKLTDILVIAVLATIARCDDWEEIEAFGEAKESWLKTFLELPNGIPSHDTFRRVFSLLKPASLQDCLTKWLQSIGELPNGEVIALDGKTLKRSFDQANKKTGLHLVNAWATERGIILGQVAVDEKSNEIVAIPELLNSVEVKGSVITIDAIGCQKGIAKQIRENQADYVLGLKANHLTLLRNTKKLLEEVELGIQANLEYSKHETIEKDHGRIETRRCVAVTAVGVPHAEDWKDLASVVMIERIREVNGKVSTKKHYYISSLAPNAEVIASKVRDHWKVENTLHWTLDVIFGEDQSRIRDKIGAQNLSFLRKFAISLLKNEPTPKISMKRKRLIAGWDNEFLLRVLTQSNNSGKA